MKNFVKYEELNRKEGNIQLTGKKQCHSFRKY
jgi:hypothetical protein